MIKCIFNYVKDDVQCYWLDKVLVVEFLNALHYTDGKEKN